MRFSLKADHFNMSIDLHVFEPDVPYPVNAIMDVMVDSDSFSGKASMDIDIKEFTKFAANLYNIYTNLSGDARITEPYGEQMYIGFHGDGRGHIQVNGMLRSAGNELRFENVFDQTYLQTFSCELKTAYDNQLAK